MRKLSKRTIFFIVIGLVVVVLIVLNLLLTGVIDLQSSVEVTSIAPEDGQSIYPDSVIVINLNSAVDTSDLVAEDNVDGTLNVVSAGKGIYQITPIGAWQEGGHVSSIFYQQDLLVSVAFTVLQFDTDDDSGLNLQPGAGNINETENLTQLKNDLPIYSTYYSLELGQNSILVRYDSSKSQVIQGIYALLKQYGVDPSHPDLVYKPWGTEYEGSPDE